MAYYAQDTIKELRDQNEALRDALKALVAAWESIPMDDDVNEEMNVDELWMNARNALAMRGEL